MSSQSSRIDDSTSGVVALGVTAFAGVMLAIVGVFQLVQGLAAISDDGVFVSGPQYTYEIDLTTWGWIHALVGVVALAVAVGLLAGQDWARIAGMVLAGVGCVANFVFLPYFPWWSLAILAFNIAVIWALSLQLGRGPTTR